MQYKQTWELLEQKDYKIFYKKFNKYFVPAFLYGLAIHLILFTLLSFIDTSKSEIFDFLQVYAAITYPAWYFFFKAREAQKLISNNHKMVKTGQIIKKCRKLYLIKGRKKMAGILSLGNIEVVVSDNIFSSFQEKEIIALHYLKNSDEFFRYEKITP